MTDDFKEWLKGRPPVIQALAERFNPEDCYRMTDNDGHYCIVAFTDDGSASGKLKVAHGRDSYAPGRVVFGVNPDNVVRCGCGKWQPPTEMQVELYRRGVEAMLARRRGN